MRYFNDIAVANNGLAIVVSASYPSDMRSAYTFLSRRPYNPANAPAFPPLPPLQYGGTSNLFFDAVTGASLDGSRVLIASSAAAPSGTHMYEYNSSAGALVDTGQVLSASSIQLDRSGRRILLNHQDVYDGDFRVIGHLPADTLAATLSPDGSRVYTYNSSGQVRSFDASGASLAPISNWAPASSAGDSQLPVLMTISADSGTLFIAGSEAILVEPVH